MTKINDALGLGLHETKGKPLTTFRTKRAPRVEGIEIMTGTEAYIVVIPNRGVEFVTRPKRAKSGEIEVHGLRGRTNKPETVGILKRVEPELEPAVEDADEVEEVALDDEMMTNLQSLLLQVFDEKVDPRLASSILRESADQMNARKPTGGMTEDQANFLVSSGAMTAEQLERSEARVARGELAALEQKTRLEVVGSSLSSEEVAKKLGIKDSSVRHRALSKTLYSFQIGRKLRYPTWQFTNDPNQPVLPHLRELVEALPTDMHAASVQGFMTTPQVDLPMDDEPTTPIAWLQIGNDVQDVIDILDSFLLT